MFLLRLSFLNASWFFSLKNLSLSKVGRRGSGGPIGSSFPRYEAKERTRQTEKNQKETRKTKGRLQVSTKKNRKKIYMTHEQINVMMHALMQ